MIRAFLLSLAILFALPIASRAEVSEVDSKQLDQTIEKFYSTLNERKTEDAYKAFLSPLAVEQAQMVRNVIGMTDQVVAFFGEPFKYEKVRESSLGRQLIYRQYVMYTDKAPYIADMVMFRTSAGWKCQNIVLRDLTQDDVKP